MQYEILKTAVRFREYGQHNADLFLSEHKNREFKPSRIYRADKGFDDEGLYTDTRHSFNVQIPRSHPFIRDAARAIRYANETYFKTNVLEDMYCVENSLLQYPIGGKFDPHQDVLWPQDIKDLSRRNGFIRKLTAIMLINDPREYEGGEFALWDDITQYRVDVKKGDLFVFPSFIRHVVRPVKSGERYSLVMWSHGQF